jgi:hypothetical protein
MLGQLLGYAQRSPGDWHAAVSAASSVSGHVDDASTAGRQDAASALSIDFPAPSAHWYALPLQVHEIEI